MADLIPIPTNENAAPSILSGAQGSIITLTITDENIDVAIEAGYVRMVVERSDNGGLSYEEITVPSERPVLEPLSESNGILKFIDRRGDPGYLYRTRYVGTFEGDKILTDPSEAISGTGLALRNILTVPQLKQRYFHGIDITDDDGVPLPDSVFQFYILAAIRALEHEIDVPIIPTSFVEKHDYYREDYHAFNFLKMDYRPIISVEEFRVQYPSGQNVVIFPEEWLRIHRAEGQIQVVPTAGTLSEILVGQGGSFLPAIYNGLAYLPDLFELSYTAGFEDGKLPANIRDVIGKIASLGPFNLFGDLIVGAGIATQSLSLDGLSQSIGSTASATNAGFGARILAYQREIKEVLPLLRKYYQGIRMVVA
jgi:hypothetical protein